MRKVNIYRCPECRKPYKTLGAWANHMDMAHPDVRPKNFSDLRFFYFVLTGRDKGSCIVCKKETDWNEATGKYNRFCNNPKCKEEYKKEFNKRMISKYGKTTLMDDPDFFKKSLSKRKISGKYKFEDGGEVEYVGTYEKDFLQMLDTLLNYKSSDIMAPSPHVYYYMYEGNKHYYIPDYYIPNLNLEIEIKQNTSKHPKILAVDKVKEKLKDDVMKQNKTVNYMKIVDKNYEPMIEYLLNLKNQIPTQDITKTEFEKANIANESMTNDKMMQKEKFELVINDLNSNMNIAEEAYLIDSKQINYRVEEFKNQKEKILFVVGHSGSGKTTIANKMSETYNAEKIELDDICVPGHFSDENLKDYHPLIYKFFTSNTIGKKYRYTNEHKFSVYEELIPEFIKFITSNIGNNRFIIEGIQLLLLNTNNKISNIMKKHSVIIMGTSTIKSALRKHRRDKKDIKSTILSIIYDERYFEKELNKLRKEFMNIAQEAVVGSFIDSQPYRSPIATPDPLPEYDPVNVVSSKDVGGAGALLKSDRVVKAMLPCVLDEISGEPSDGTKPVYLPITSINNTSTPDPDENNEISERDHAISYVEKICNNFNDYSIMDQNKKINELKELIIKWNINIDFSKYPKIKRLLIHQNKKATESFIYNPGYILDYIGERLKNDDNVAIEAKIENPDDLHPVYILLTHSSTFLANLIKKYTKDKYSHAAISFDPSIKKFYTFGRKEKGGGGFSIESPDIDFYKQRPNVPYGIYCVFVNSEQLAKMKEKLQYFIENENKFKYHFMGLIKIAFGKSSENDTKFFCSGFVVDILQAAGISTKRSYSLYKPQDLTHIYSSYKILEGNGLQTIKEDVVIEKTKIAKEKYIKRFLK